MISAEGLIALAVGEGVIIHATAYGRHVDDDDPLGPHRPSARHNPPPRRCAKRVAGHSLPRRLPWRPDQLHVIRAGRELVVRCTAQDGIAAGIEAWLSVDPAHFVVLEV